MPRILIIGEAWGEAEEAARAPFVGPSGKFLRYWLRQLSFPLDEIVFTNVFNLRPQPTNDVKNLCGSRVEGIPGKPELTRGKYILAKYAGELARLEHEIISCEPNIIIALGATAAWATLGTSGIRHIRGSATRGFANVKVLPTYHPAAILRQYNLLPVFVSDLSKALRESESAELIRPQRFIHVDPDLSDLDQFYLDHIAPSSELSVDIETIQTQITCIGFAPNINNALVIPFYDPTKPGCNYWPSLFEELAAWKWIRKVLSEPRRILGQNFNYDMKFIWAQYGIPIPHASDDIMLMHHAQQPELEKSLAFMGSIYTDELAWKFQRPKHTVKQED